MVTVFRRSFSLPVAKSIARSTPRHTKSRAKDKSHVRCTSLPCRSHPVVAQLEDEIGVLRDWQSQSEPQSGSPAWLCTGMVQLELLHDSMRSFLQLPQMQESLCHCSSWIERILEDFLLFADAYGTFRSAILDLKEHQSTAQVAFRRRDEARLASCIRSQKKIEKELFKLSSEICDISKPPAVSRFVSDSKEADLVEIMTEVASVTASTSASIFLGIAALSATTSAIASCSSSTPSWMVSHLRRLSSAKHRSMEDEKEMAWRQSALDKLEGLEKCIGALESRNGRVLRSLLNTRVSLLNILTPSM